MQDLPIIAYKNLGETPLEALERVRKERNIDKDVPMTYAGRLDPMAEGVLLILTGDECKNKEKYLGLDKVYEFQVLVGFATDTHDLLGLTTTSEIVFERSSDLLTLQLGQTVSKTISDFVSVMEEFTGTFIQKYPSFSSKTVNGKQLFQLSKDDEFPDKMPEHEVTIYELKNTDEEKITKEDLEKEIERRINLVKGDFRQEEILKKWNEEFEKTDKKEFQIINFTCKCSSGTYIRQLVADMSEKIGVPLVTYSIKRTKVGEYKI